MGRQKRTRVTVGAAPMVTSRGRCVSGYEPGGARCGGGGDLNWNSFGGVWGWEGKVLRVTEVLGAVGYHPHAFSAGREPLGSKAV